MFRLLACCLLACYTHVVAKTHEMDNDTHTNTRKNVEIATTTATVPVTATKTAKAHLGLVVAFVHFMFVVYVITGPFLLPARGGLLLQYVMVILSVVMHWAHNSDVCVVTNLEAWMRDIPREETFVYSIIAPIYRLSWAKKGYTIMAVLACVAAWRIFRAGTGNFDGLEVLLPSRWSQRTQKSTTDDTTDDTADDHTAHAAQT